MSKVKVELIMPGLNAIMKSAEMQAQVGAAGARVAAMTGHDYGVRIHLGDWTAIANVYPNSKEAAKDNSENNTLLKALGAAKG